MSEWAKHHLDLLDDARINRKDRVYVENATDAVIRNKDRYERAGLAYAIPWHVVGAIHMREAWPPFSFERHLANGDPLFDEHGVAVPTVHAPKGLGPYQSWEASAVGAFALKRWDKGFHWDLANALENLEMWNGIGYRKEDVNTPYLWSMTNMYDRGKFTKDHVFEESFIDAQVGCAALFLCLEERGYDLDEKRPLG